MKRFTDIQTLFLAAAAFTGVNLRDDDIQILSDIGNYSVDDLYQAMEDLISVGIYDASWGISRNWLLKAIYLTLDTHPEWPDLFRTSGLKQDSHMEEIWSTCIAAEYQTPDLKLPHSIKKILPPLLDSEQYHHIYDILTGREMIDLCSQALRNALQSDTITEEFLDNLSTNIRKFFVSQGGRGHFLLLDEIAFYRYLLNGSTMVRMDAMTSKFALFAEAISQYMQGDAKGAAEKFRESISSNDTIKIPDNYVASYFYIESLRKTGQKEILDRLSSDNSIPAELGLLADSDELDNNTIGERVNFLKQNTESPLGRQILFIISRRNNLPDIAGLNTIENLPSLGIMRLECADWMSMPDVDALKRAFNLSDTANMPAKEEWKSHIEGLERFLNDPAGPANVAKGSRVKYIFYDGSLIGLREQVANEDHVWGEEKLLSYNQFLECKYPFMDETDNQIAAALRELNRTRGVSIYRNEAEALMPMLVGSDRVYSPQGPLRIVTGIPKVAFHVDNNKISPVVNLDVDTNGTLHPVKVWKDAEGNCVVVSANPQQRRLIDMLLNAKDAPLESAQAFINLSVPMSKQIDVDVHELQAIMNATPLRGEGRVMVRIIPNKVSGTYTINWLAAPVIDGKCRFDPGTGDEEYLEVIDNIAYRISRDLKKEMDNLNNLTGFITSCLAPFMVNTKTLLIRMTMDLVRLLEFVHDHPDDYSMEWPKGSEIKFKGKTIMAGSEIEISSGINWFGIDGSIQVGTTKIPLKKMLSLDLSGEKEYVEIDEKEYIRINDVLRRQLSAISTLRTDALDPKVSKFQVGQLAQALGLGGINVKTDEAFEKQQELIKAACEINPEVPRDLEATLRPYQEEGYKWMSRLSAWGAGGCLADDMGLGKTVQTIAFLLSKADDGPSLVIAPTSVIPNWVKELARFAPTLRPINLNSAANRPLLVANAEARDVCLASYGMMTHNQETMSSREWNVICLDEAHQIKNRNTQVARAALGLVGKNRLILTGTPVQNSVSDLWTLFQFINPGMLGNYEHFRQTYCASEPVTQDALLQELKKLTMPFILRRTKQEVLDELPKKTEVDLMVQQSEDESVRYENLRSSIKAGFISMTQSNQGGSFISFFEGLTRLRTACCSFNLLDPFWEGGSSKISELHFILQGICKQDNKILIFSQFTSFLEIVRRLLDSMHIACLYLDGSTPINQRSELVDEFQRGECGVFLISLKAGGLGLNLTAANYVILMDPWWNPSIEGQAIDRAYRIGQTRDVTVIRLIAAGTIEEKIIELQERKRNISDDILSGTGISDKLSFEEIMEMVSK